MTDEVTVEDTLGSMPLAIMLPLGPFGLIWGMVCMVGLATPETLMLAPEEEAGAELLSPMSSKRSSGRSSFNVFNKSERQSELVNF